MFAIAEWQDAKGQLVREYNRVQESFAAQADTARALQRCLLGETGTQPAHRDRGTARHATFRLYCWMSLRSRRAFAESQVIWTLMIHPVGGAWNLRDVISLARGTESRGNGVQDSQCLLQS